MSAEPDPLLASLLAAVGRAPDDGPLRLHVAGLLLDAGRPAEALAHCAAALSTAPGDPAAAALLGRISAAMSTPPGSGGPTPALHEPQAGAGDAEAGGFDWHRAEEQMSEPGRPGYPTDPRHGAGVTGPVGSPSPPDGRPGPLDRPATTLADVGGMEEVKEEIRMSFLVPMANPELRAAYGATIGGGLLLYGPPGCGKTYLARAVAGELGAGFTSVAIADVLDMWVGASERNLKSVFDTARSHRPSVVFLDEIDALGQRRSNLRHSPAMRGAVNQLLAEMDGATSDNDGVYVLAATNQPWDVDPALRRPGRFDRVLFVAPPDLPARAAILRTHLAGRPVGDVDLDAVARRTEGWSGADLSHLVTTALRRALASSAATGTVRPLSQHDLDAARSAGRPSTTEWLETARNAATYANLDGTYDALDAYLKRRR